MKNIVVVATALRTSGALTIYKQFLTNLRCNVENNYYLIFIDPSMPKIDIPNVEYVEINTSSIFYRIYFDYYLCNKILKSRNLNIDVIISLQNTGVYYSKSCKKIIYYHQPLPFYSYKWNIFKSSELSCFLYKKIYPFFVKSLIDKETEFIVQIPYIKECFIRKIKVKKEKVHVLFPDLEDIDINKIEPYNYNDDNIHFIYPATPVSYKNHKIILEALFNLKQKNPILLEKIKIHFTISKDKADFIYVLVKKYTLEDIVIFEGVVPHQILLSMYKSSTALLYPSLIETLGLPLIEAAAFGLPILVADLEYSRQVLKDYNGQIYLSPTDSYQWEKEILNIITFPEKYSCLKASQESSWTDFFKLVNNAN